MTLKNQSLKLPLVQGTLEELPISRPEWLAWDEVTKSAHVAHLPSAEDVPFPVDVQQVVEYYANRM